MALPLTAYHHKSCRNTEGTIKEMSMTEINNDLVTALVAHLALKGKNAGMYGASAILVFVPGLEEITNLFNTMKVQSACVHKGLQRFALEDGNRSHACLHSLFSSG
jgi:hypothetical protein